MTNGMLITDDVISKMKETHMSTITISLDGMKRLMKNLDMYLDLLTKLSLLLKS